MSKNLPKSKFMKILIVDDNSDNIELMSQILEDDYSVIRAKSGKECIEKALLEQPDLILLDVNMPEMDGYETIQFLKKDEATQKIPVIFVSAYYTESAMIVKGLEQGAFDYLTKPVDENIVRAKVRVVERIKQAEDEVLQQKNELQVMNKKQKSADKLKSIFLASMSHELRTPLNSIIGFTGLMLMQVAGSINDGQKEQLNRVKRNAEHLLELINDVLDISKVEAGKIELSIAEVDINALVNDVVESITPEVDAKGLALNVRKLNENVNIKSDIRRLKQILMNLMSNALKFTDVGSVSIDVSIEQSQLIIIVKDTGVGIEISDMKKLFEPFQQINSDFTNNYKGTGLGLYLCKKLASLIGAEINVTSELGIGSQFLLALPIDINEGNLSL